VGAHWRKAWEANDLAIGMWLGRSWDSGMHLDLLGFDRTSVALDSVHELDAELTWGINLSKLVSVRFQTGMHLREISQSDATVMTRSGEAVGSAFQPRTVVRVIPVRMGLAYQF
jgi:hypothetical protein